MTKGFVSEFQHFIQHKFLLKVLKWIIMFGAYAYLLIVLVRFEHYSELWSSFRHLSLVKVGWITIVLVFLPVNILLEAFKWKVIVAKTEKLSVRSSLKAVLAGFATGFFTPNRSGEFVGRIALLKSGNRKVGVMYALINSLSQNIVLIFFGLPAFFFYFLSRTHAVWLNYPLYFVALIILLLLLLFFYFTLSYWAKTMIWKKLFPFAKDVEHFTILKLLSIFGYSFLRYIVFSIQLFATLQFFNVNLELWQALLSIPTSYLLITVTPSFAMSEAAIRGSMAVLIIGTFSVNAGGIALAGISLWLLNFGIPMLLGSSILVKNTVLDSQSEHSQSLNI